MAAPAHAFALRGRIVDEEERLKGYTREDLFIRAVASEQTTFRVTPDSSGSYRIDSLLPILTLSLNDTEGRTHATRAGPWLKDSRVDLDLSPASWE